jgi:DNA replication protein DnaC
MSKINFTEEFVPCRLCAKKPDSRIPKGYYPDKDVLEGIKECDHHVEWRKTKSEIDSFVARGFRKDFYFLDYPEGYVGNKSRANVERLVQFIEGFKESRSNKEGLAVREATLFFHGPRGCQKTLTAGWVAAELFRAGFGCRFTYMHTLIRELWDAERNEDARERLRSLLECDLLVIDESFDKDKVGMWASGKQLPFLDTFIRSRNRMKCTVFISNIKMEDVDPIFGLSLKDLIIRETKYFNSYMEFLDNYLDLTNDIPTSNGGLF